MSLKISKMQERRSTLARPGAAARPWPERRRAARDARRAEIEAAKKVRKQRKETARTRFAQRLGCSPDGKLRYLDWSFSALKGEAQMRAEHDRAIASESEMHRAMLQAVERAEAAQAAQRLAEAHATEAARQWRERRQTPWHQVPRLACGPYDQSQVRGP